jgi:hypothetical protein
MKTITAIAARNLGKFLAKDIRQLFGSAQQDRAERLGSLAQSTIECLGRRDALFESWVFCKNRYVIGDVESGGTCQLAKLAGDPRNRLARPGQLAGNKCRTTTVAGLRHRAKLCSQNRAAEPEIIENAVAFLGGAFGQFFERTGTGQICGLGLAADMVRPVPPNSVAVDTKLVGESVDTSAASPQ